MLKDSVLVGLMVTLGTMTPVAQPAPTSTSANLRLERAPSVTGPWSALPADQLPPSGDGGLLDPLSPEGSFYRLRIDLKDPQGGPLGLPLAAVPPTVFEVAFERLESLRGEEPDWVHAELGAVVTPVYNPAFQKGIEPAWYEFKVVPNASRASASSAHEGFQQSPPSLPEGDLGYLLVASGPQDEPVPQYATSGITPSERLRLRAGTVHLRVIRYSESFWVAENGKGDALATLGSTPVRFGPELLELAGVTMGVEVENGKETARDPVPALSVGAFQTYDGFRQNYLDDAVPKRIREYQATFGRMEWDLRDGKIPPVLEVPLNESVTVLGEQRFRSADVEDDIALVTVNPKGGLDIAGLVEDSALLTTVRADGALELLLLVVGNPQRQIQPLGWTSWTTYYGASCAQIPAYEQEWNLSGACNNGWSGCGATAWAMFYGYWDSRGVDNLIAGGTPWSNNNAVRDLIRAVFDLCDSWCTSGGQAATNPWDMSEGYRWAGAQGESISMSSRWSLPYTSSRPRNKAQAAIKDNNRPAIVGTGYLAHYPMAYGYRYRKYRRFGVTWKTERHWKVNQGWGSSSCEWVSASGCWFGMNARCY